MTDLIDRALLTDDELHNLKDWVDADCRGKSIDPRKAADAATKKAIRVTLEEVEEMVVDKVDRLLRFFGADYAIQLEPIRTALADFARMKAQEK